MPLRPARNQLLGALGTGGSLIAALACAAVLLSGIVAFDAWRDAPLDGGAGTPLRLPADEGGGAAGPPDVVLPGDGGADAAAGGPGAGAAGITAGGAPGAGAPGAGAPGSGAPGAGGTPGGGTVAPSSPADAVATLPRPAPPPDTVLTDPVEELSHTVGQTVVATGTLLSDATAPLPGPIADVGRTLGGLVEHTGSLLTRPDSS